MAKTPEAIKRHIEDNIKRYKYCKDCGTVMQTTGYRWTDWIPEISWPMYRTDTGAKINYDGLLLYCPAVMKHHKYFIDEKGDIHGNAKSNS